MKNKYLFSLSVVSVLALAVLAVEYAPASYARDGSSEDQSSVQPSASNEPSETPETRIENEGHPSVSPLASVSVSPLAKPRGASEQQSKAIEKYNEAQSKLSELKLKLAKDVVNVPQSVQTLTDLATQKLADAKTALDNQDFGQAFGQTQAAESIVKNALRMLENEKEAALVQSGLSQEIENEDISSIEIGSTASQSDLNIERKDRTRTRMIVPESSVSLFQVKTEEGTLGAHIASGSRAVIDDNNIDVESDFPLVFNVASKTFSVQTPNGTKVIRVLPSRAFARLDSKDKPDSLNKVSLVEDGDKLVFQADGTRSGKVFGFIPVTISVKTAVDSQTGDVVSVDKPWFIDLLGPLFQ